MSVERFANRMEELRAREADLRLALDTSTLTPAQRRELEDELQAANSAATRIQFALHDLIDATARLEDLRKLQAALDRALDALGDGAKAIGRGEAMSLDLAPLEIQMRDRLARLRHRIEILEEDEHRALAKLEAVEGKAQAA